MYAAIMDDGGRRWCVAAIIVNDRTIALEAGSPPNAQG
jgi:hypothetical protein